MGWSDERIHEDHPATTILVMVALVGGAVFVILSLCGVFHA